MNVTFLCSLNIAHGGGTVAGASTVEKDLDASGLKAFNTQVLSTSLADLNIGALTWSNGTYLVVQNLDTTNTVILAKSAVEFAEIPPSSVAAFKIKPDGTAIRAKSSAGTPTIGVTIAGPLA